jgi:hypothetical protein
MTYSVGGKVQAFDYNTFANNAVAITTAFSAINNAAIAINTVWGNTDSGQFGYGQPRIGSVGIGGKITSTEWTTLVDTLNKATKHQTGSDTTIANISTTIDSKVSVLNGIPSVLVQSINRLQANALNAASQGAVVTFTTTNTKGWSDLLIFSSRITFANENAARYFFNSGGQIGLSYTHSSNTSGINPLIANICSSVGTIWISAPGGANTVTLAGSTYPGVSRRGGSGNLISINTSGGYYGLTVTPLQIVYQRSAISYRSSSYSATNLTISASSDGFALTITSAFDETFSNVPFAVDAGTAVTVSVRPPETTNLANTWGAVNVSTQVVLAI